MSGPKAKVTDEQIRERCQLADERGEPLQAVADDLGIALRILGKHRRRLGMSGRQNGGARAAGQRGRNERERREHPGGAHIDQLPIMGMAQRRKLSSQGDLHRSSASVEKQLTTSDARYRGWRTERPAKARAVLKKTVITRYNLRGKARGKWADHQMTTARAGRIDPTTGRVRVHPVSTATRAKQSVAATRLAIERGSGYAKARQALATAKTPKDIAVLKDRFAGDPAALELIGKQPRRGRKVKHSPSAVLADLERGDSPKKVAAAHGINVRTVQRIRRVAREAFATKTPPDCNPA